jgi:hypothetical protein
MKETFLSIHAFNYDSTCLVFVSEGQGGNNSEKQNHGRLEQVREREGARARAQASEREGSSPLTSSQK